MNAIEYAWQLREAEQHVTRALAAIAAAETAADGETREVEVTRLAGSDAQALGNRLRSARLAFGQRVQLGLIG